MTPSATPASSEPASWVEFHDDFTPNSEPQQGRRILIISPAKDEADYIQRTLTSVTNQTLRPARWIIVNDGSSDATGELADQAAAQHDWISVLHRPAGTQRRVGPGVMEAFYAGLEQDSLDDYDYVCKLDADLEFAPTYFADLIKRFEADPRLGTISGKCYIPVDGQLVYERAGDEFSHGAAKLYRRVCFQEIGGFVREVMWDGIDCHRCRMFGWKALSDHDPSIRIIHLRQMGSSFRSVYHGRRRWGRGQYFMGTHPVYALAISTYRMAERPWILGGLCIIYGYLSAWARRAPRYNDLKFRKHLHRWQWKKLFQMVGLGRDKTNAISTGSTPDQKKPITLTDDDSTRSPSPETPAS